MQYIDSAALEQIKDQLAHSGFLLCDLKAVDVLPDSVWLESMPGNTRPNKDLLDPAIRSSGSLLLIGHAGPLFWQVFSARMNQAARSKPDPVDNYSTAVTAQILEHCLPDTAKQCLFPSDDCPINLMALGKVLGWHTPSPIGMGIHAKYGLWSAYRALWWLDGTLEGRAPYTKATADAAVSLGTDICAQCNTQECVSACPVGAITYGQTPALDRCADHRLQQDSSCESTCHARLACPYAKQHRYTTEQMAYHYELARSAIAKYR